MSPEALERELDHLHPAAFGWALACCAGDRAAAEDALQASYLKILDGRARFDGRASFRTWLFSVVRYTAGRGAAARGAAALAAARRPERHVRRPARRRDRAGARGRDAPADGGAQRAPATPARSAAPGVLPGPDDRRGGASCGRLARHRPHPLRARQVSAQKAPEGSTGMTEHTDPDLEERFHRLRRAEATAAAAFPAMVSAARARQSAMPRRRALGLGAAAIVIAGVAVAILLTRRAVQADLATVRLKTPTDFLLALPNEELLRTVPELGRVTIILDRRTP